MFKKIIGWVFLCCFVFSSGVEAGQRSARYSASTTNKKIKKPTIRKKREAIAPRKRPQGASRAGNRSRTAAARQRQPRTGAIRKTAPRKRPQGAPRAGNRSRTAAARQRQPRTGAIRKTAPSKLRPTGKGRRRPLPVSIAPPSPIIPPASPPPYLSQLKPFTQRNAQQGGLDKLFLKDLKGQGITVAVIEQSGTWTPLRDAINNVQGNLSPEARERYRNNFLPAMGGGDFTSRRTK